MDLDCQCSNTSHSGISGQSSCDGSAERTTQRTTLRELMQLPSDCESSTQNSPVSQYLDCQEEENLEQLDAVPEQYKRWRIWNCVKGLSWSSLFKRRDKQNNKPQRNKNGGASAKVTKLWKKNHTPQTEIKIEKSTGTEPSFCSTVSGSRRGNEERKVNLGENQDLQPHCNSACGSSDGVCSPCGDGAGLLPGCGVEHDEEHSCQNSADHHGKHKKNELVEDEDRGGWKSLSFDTHEVEKDVNEETISNLQQKESAHLEVGVSKLEMCIEFNDHMLAQSSKGGYAEKSISWNAAALLSAEYGYPYQNLSQSKTWEVFELIDVCTEKDERLKKLCTEEEERLKKQEAVPKDYKWWRILNGDKRRTWSSLLRPRDRDKKQHQRKNKQNVTLPRDEVNKKPRRKNKIGDLPRYMENKKHERRNKNRRGFFQGNEPVFPERIKRTPLNERKNPPGMELTQGI